MEITLGGFALVAIIGELVALAEQLGIATRWLPLFSIVVGIVIGVVAFFTGTVGFMPAILAGFFAGAATSGLYDVGKKTILGQ